ncbi:pyranose 2-oxidase [Striga asiatica]|uniref:Pyranose 2-oxidase n=1 Tax=Striga asiatica TaxID=4170 RepID=A0A5A7PXB5_STRAF|nr:pyranose 2-oxidase [Striga asiatica]
MNSAARRLALTLPAMASSYHNSCMINKNNTNTINEISFQNDTDHLIDNVVNGNLVDIWIELYSSSISRSEFPPETKAAAWTAPEAVAVVLVAEEEAEAMVVVVVVVTGAAVAEVRLLRCGHDEERGQLTGASPCDSLISFDILEEGTVWEEAVKGLIY